MSSIAKKAKKAKKANSGTDDDCPKPPRFETFVVIVLPGDEQQWCDDEIRGVDFVYEWRTDPFWSAWENRAAWIGAPLGYSDPQRSTTLNTLATSSWQPLHNLQKLLTATRSPPPTRRLQKQVKRSRDEGYHGVDCAKPLDVIMPHGLQKFLASLAQRPSSYEQLCRTLWERESATSLSVKKPAAMPLWYHDTCSTDHVNEHNLSQWWWAGVIGAAANAVKQLMNSVTAKKKTAYLVV